MHALNLELLTKEISSESPCGDNLEYDAEYVELKNAAAGKPEKVMGEEQIPAEPPDWNKVQSLSLNLLPRTKDIFVTVYLIRALLQIEGWEGFSNGMSLLLKLLTDYWDTIHPLLDVEDDNDPTLRLNTLSAIDDQITMLNLIRQTPIVSHKGIGQFSIKDVEIASGKIPPLKDKEAPKTAEIEAAFKECELNDLKATGQAVDSALNSTLSIRKLLIKKVGVDRAPDLKQLTQALKNVQSQLKTHLANRTGTEGSDSNGESVQQGNGSNQPIAGEVRNRTEVITLLDKICNYYQQHEPSSPVPLLLQRAKRLVSKDFLEIIRDLAPDSMTQTVKIVGAKADK